MTNIIDLKLHFRIFSCGLKTVLAERLHELKFPGSSTMRADCRTGAWNVRRTRRTCYIDHVAPYLTTWFVRLRVRIRSGHYFFFPVSLRVCMRVL